jgi:hypothetical protein
MVVFDLLILGGVELRMYLQGGTLFGYALIHMGVLDILVYIDAYISAAGCTDLS